MSKSIEDRVAEKLKEAMEEARNVVYEDIAVVHDDAETPVESDFVGDAPSEDGEKFSEVFGMSPPEGLPDLTAPVYEAGDWDEEDVQFIPPKDKFENYVPNVEVLYDLWTGVLRNNKKALLVGPTGSGKTSIQEYFCSMINQPYLRFSGRQDMESDSILGRPWVHDGSMDYELGELPKAARKGWWLAFDEPWKTPAGIQMALQRFYEKDGVFQIDDMPGKLEDKIVTPDPRCRLVLADNVVGTGDNMDKFGATMIQDGSTLNRLDIIINVPYMDEEDEAEMIVKSVPTISKKAATNMVRFFNLCRVSYEQGALSAALSPRNLLSWAELASDLKNIEAAAQRTIFNRFAEDSELALVREHYRTVYGS